MEGLLSTGPPPSSFLNNSSFLQEDLILHIEHLTQLRCVQSDEVLMGNGELSNIYTAKD